ncbi:30 kDa salivary gland allergen Aed a 3-like [Aedes albopictus]|uniref:Aegyptin/gSG7 salivary protein-like four-helix bundle domain-containing protein n=1 Tax=Aedes albopictus TaxID=7160 RepID=A0ABM1XQW2_AEDAL
MRSLLVLFAALCLVGFVLAKPIPEDDTEATTEEPKAEDAAEQTTAEDAGGSDGEKNDDEKPSDDASANDQPKDVEGEGDGKESPKTEGEAKNDPQETYNKVIELLDQIKVDNVENGYERSELTSDLQTYLRNPIVDAIGTVGDFSKIADCFKSMGDETKKAIEEELKAFKECTDKKDSDEYQCSKNHSTVQGKIAKISSTINSCVVSNRA